MHSGSHRIVLMSLKRRVVHTFQRHLVNPIGRKVAPTLLETTGRKSGQPRVTAVGGRVIDNAYWLVSGHGEHSDYIKNIKANQAVRIRLRGTWRTGTAHLLPDDDAAARLRELPTGNSAVVRLVGTELLTVRVDLD
jgi:deazaflavin-dependent oxidoreductase (nitroreductase family)